MVIGLVNLTRIALVQKETEKELTLLHPFRSGESYYRIHSALNAFCNRNNASWMQHPVSVSTTEPG